MALCEFSGVTVMMQQVETRESAQMAGEKNEFFARTARAVFVTSEEELAPLKVACRPAHSRVIASDCPGLIGDDSREREREREE